MKKSRWFGIISVMLMLCLVASVAASNLSFDYNQDGKTTVWDLQYVSDTDKDAALEEVIGGKDEMRKNENGQWEIWTKLGLYHMAELAQSGDTFVLMQDIDLQGETWYPIENFKGTLYGQMHTVSNMKIVRSDKGDQGFFAQIDAGGTVHRLNLKDVNLIAADNAVNIGLLAASCAGTVDACTTIGYMWDSRTTLPADVYVGGLVGRLQDSGRILTHVENMLYADPSEPIPNISSQLATDFATTESDTYERNVGIVGHKGNGELDTMALLQDLTGTMPDPNAIAWVTNGDVRKYPRSVDELLAMISPDGNSVVTLQQDLYVDYSLDVPYSSTWDLNGYTIDGNPEVGYGLNILGTGTENKVTTVMNGTISTYSLCIRAERGGVAVHNAELYSVYSACIGIYDTSADYNDQNIIADSALYSAEWGVLSFNQKNADFSDVKITVERSKLVSYKSSGTSVFVKQSGATTGTVALGYNVEFYTYGASIASNVGVTGVEPMVMEKADVDVNGKTYQGMSHWTTDEAVLSTEPIAEVTNGNKTIPVTSTGAIVDAVAADGNTKITLLKDITNTAAMNLPYTCEIDLNGHSITNTAGNSIRFLAKGSKNTVAKVTNGTINHAVIGVRVDEGSVDISQVTFNGLPGCNASVGFYNTSSAYRAGNKIDNCSFYNPEMACISFAKASSNFQNTGVTISNSTLISDNSYVFDKASGATSGVITLGEKVHMYGKNETLAPDAYRYSGMLAGLTENAKVTVDGSEMMLNCWSTDKQTETVNVLLVGNSLSMTIPRELYQIAKHDGTELFVGDLYHAGCRGWQHWEWYNNKSAEYQFRIQNDMGLWIHGDIKTSNEAIDYLNWEHVSYQEYITRTYAPTKEEALSNHEVYVDNMINMLKTECADAEFYYYQHWSFQVGHSAIPNVAIQEEQANILIELSQYFGEKHGVKVIPCGQAWEAARDDASIGDTLCKADFLHASEESGGLYLNGCVFYETMFQKTCIGDTWRAPNGPSEEKHITLQQIAHNAVAAVHGENYAK